MLAGKGYKKIYNMAGGIKAWDAEIAVGPQDLGVHLFSGQEQPEDVLKTAYSLEQGLREFYLSMADQAVDPGVQGHRSLVSVAPLPLVLIFQRDSRPAGMQCCPAVVSVVVAV